MRSNTTYIPIRDDVDGIKSLSTIERSFIREAALAGHPLRTDGRKLHEIRPQDLSLLRGDNFTTSTVQYGHSRVTVSLHAELIPPPNADRPNEGVVFISVDLSPSASAGYKSAAPATSGGFMSSSVRDTIQAGPPDEHQKLLANRILRCLERLLLAGTGSCLDAEALCVTPEYWVWKLNLQVTVVDASGGNLLDACALAAMAALRHFRLPHTETTSDAPPTLISADVKEPVPLPLHHTPLCISFALIANQDHLANADNNNSSSSTPSNERHVVALIDPNSREELVATGTLTLALNIHGEVCWIDFGGGCELLAGTLRECWKIADTTVRKMCESFEKTLREADARALQERLDRLKGLSGSSLPKTSETVPFYQGADEDDVYMHVAPPNDSDLQQSLDAKEEAHRKQALDYNMGHMPTRVRDDARDTRGRPSSALLASILQSVRPDTDATGETEPKQDTTHKIDDMDVDVSISVPAPPASTVHSRTQSRSAVLDSDEEETTHVLTSEFATDDVDDLAAAMKKKPKKKKK